MNGKTEEKNWTGFLKNLKVGTHSKKMESVEDIESMVSVGYRLNAQGYEKVFSFSKNYKELVVAITVTKR